MEKLQNKARLFLILGIVSSVLGAIAIPGIPIFAGKNLALMILSIVFAAHAFYGVPMYFLAYASARRSLRLLSLVVENRQRSYATLSSCLSVPESVVKRMLESCILQGSLMGFRMGEDALIPLVDEAKDEEPKPTEITCEYCGLVVAADASVCPNCGAPMSARSEKR